MYTLLNNYTKEMYEGNEPSRIEKRNGSVYEYWNNKYGECNTKDKAIIGARFNIDKHKTIYIIGDSLWIVKLLQNEIVQYCYKWDGIVCYSDALIKPMSKEEAEKILNTKIENCIVWNIIQKRAKELYKESSF